MDEGWGGWGDSSTLNLLCTLLLLLIHLLYLRSSGTRSWRLRTPVLEGMIFGVQIVNLSFIALGPKLNTVSNSLFSSSVSCC